MTTTLCKRDFISKCVINWVIKLMVDIQLAVTSISEESCCYRQFALRMGTASFFLAFFGQEKRYSGQPARRERPNPNSYFISLIPLAKSHFIYNFSPSCVLTT